ncbi:hypothetical protein ACFC36_16215 [Streptomyces rubiginosohelvolus]|uniref:hypothetical protein n=1 Tax=Streptomyces rubiginosohelvolus TaxID=67362 RepID=UPI0035D92FB4
MNPNHSVHGQIAQIIADIDALYARQSATLTEQWGDEVDVPTEELSEYDEITYNQLVEDADLLGAVRRRLVALLEPAPA